MTYNPRQTFEAGRGSIYSSYKPPSKSKPKPSRNTGRGGSYFSDITPSKPKPPVKKTGGSYFSDITPSKPKPPSKNTGGYDPVGGGSIDDPGYKGPGLGSPPNTGNNNDDSSSQDTFIDTLMKKVKSSFNFAGGTSQNDEPTDPDPVSVYTADVFASPVIQVGYENPNDMRSGEEIATDIARMFDRSKDKGYYQYSTEAGSRYDEVPAASANKNLEVNKTKSAVERFLKEVIAPDSKQYKIKKNDTLSAIALREGITVADLVKVNGIKDKDRIYTDETLIIPESKDMQKVKDFVDSIDPDAEFSQSGVPMDQREFAPEDTSELNNPQTQQGLMSTDPVTGYDEIDLPTEAEVDKKIKGLGARPDVTVTELDATDPTTLTAAQRTALSDMGSDVARTNLQNITNAQGNYSQTALTNAVDKGIRNETKRALLKGASQTEVGEAGPVTEGGYGIENLADFTGEWRNRSIAAGLLDAEGNVTQLARNLNSQNNLAETIFDVQYADRMGNGDIASRDGSTYKGRGLIQITGKGTYQAVENILESNGINIDLVGNPELANDTRYALPIALAYLEHAGLDETAAANSSAKDLNNRVNSGADAGTAEERWENVVSNLSGDEATRMENRNEYAAQRTVGTTVDGAIGPNSRVAMTTWLNENNVTIPPNATDIDLVVLVNENS